MIRSKLISIGDEILIGQIVNTNAAYLGEKLFSIGIPVHRTVVIADEESSLLEEFEDSLKNYDVTIITGGLGPTHDDITKPALTRFFNDELVTDNKVLEHVKKFFASRKINMPAVNEGQALVPKNSEVIWNYNGTAPGIWIEKNGRIFVALPGVPYEMKPMIEDFVLPRLINKFSTDSGKVFMQKTLLTTGIGESSLFELFGDIDMMLDGNKLAFLPSATGVRLRMNVVGIDETDARKKIENLEKRIKEKAGDYVFGENDESLQSVIGKLLKQSGKTLSVAESCTGGRISTSIVSIAGSSDYYLGGICAYANEEKIRLLKVSQEDLRQHGAVSREVAVQMAEGVRNIMGADYALSTTGIAGPSGATPEKPIGLVWIGFSSSEKSYAMDFHFGNRRDINIERASQRALEILRRELLNIKIKF
jgi:nicotinamide-nucleotide amidase